MRYLEGNVEFDEQLIVVIYWIIVTVLPSPIIIMLMFKTMQLTIWK